MCLSRLGAASNSQAVRGPGNLLGKLESYQRGFNWNIPFKCRRLKPWFDFFQRISEEWKSRQILIFWGYMLRKCQGAPWSLITPCICQLPSSWPCHGWDSSHWLPADYSLLSSSVYEILQARILEWVVVSFSRDWTWVSCIAGSFFTVWDTREAILPLWWTSVSSVTQSCPTPQNCLNPAGPGVGCAVKNEGFNLLWRTVIKHSQFILILFNP